MRCVLVCRMLPSKRNTSAQATVQWHPRKDHAASDSVAPFGPERQHTTAVRGLYRGMHTMVPLTRLEKLPERDKAPVLQMSLWQVQYKRTVITRARGFSFLPGSGLFWAVMEGVQAPAGPGDQDRPAYPPASSMEPQNPPTCRSTAVAMYHRPPSIPCYPILSHSVRHIYSAALVFAPPGFLRLLSPPLRLSLTPLDP